MPSIERLIELGGSDQQVVDGSVNLLGNLLGIIRILGLVINLYLNKVVVDYYCYFLVFKLIFMF